MDMRALIAKLTALEEESSKDKDYDHDSLDKDDVDYIAKNSKDSDDEEYEPGEEDKEVKESKDSKNFDWEAHDKKLDATGRYNRKEDDDFLNDMPDENDDCWVKPKKEKVKDKVKESYSDYDDADYSYDDAYSSMTDDVNDIMDDALEAAKHGNIEKAEHLRHKALVAAGGSLQLRNKINDVDFEEYYNEYGEPENDMEESAMLGECGGDSMPVQSQNDTVSMTINMSGSGKGGIHDILDVIRNIEKGNPVGNNPVPPVGDKELNRDATMIIGSEQLEDDLSSAYSNSPNEKYSTLKSIAGAGPGFGKQPHTMSPALDIKTKLESLYQFVKSR